MALTNTLATVWGVPGASPLHGDSFFVQCARDVSIAKALVSQNGHPLDHRSLNRVLYENAALGAEAVGRRPVGIPALLGLVESSASQSASDHVSFQLADRTQDLPSEGSHWIIRVVGQNLASIGREDLDAKVLGPTVLF